ncbi:decapping and exoribonuclease protein-like isoform X1 [Varroa jacobsoni]|uniref:Decapping nuclease n=2 Tax=Varroa destructor TaxID=109461 RepID=A0A7M7J963_VARDE|nr:decapping and exoribonuclease protein-like isoform X1 [Varroa destructor]XP_022708857.1 decapping and exoribonuclease protein-like isoform X1 [Varroa jacobsoni]
MSSANRPKRDEKLKMEILNLPTCAVLRVTPPQGGHEQINSELDLREPVELGNFSLIGDRNYVHDTRKMAYLIEPPQDQRLDWDLNEAFDDRIPKNHSLSEKLDNLLRWICDNVEKFRAPCDGENSKLSGLHTDFVSYRGLLTTIMCSVYEQKENWILGVTLYKGSRYLCQYSTLEQIEREKNKSGWFERVAAWGYKFEQYMTASRPGGRPTPQEPINEKEEFCSVVRTRLGQRHSLVYGAEVDGVDDRLVAKYPEYKHSTRRYVEFKTSRFVETSRQRKNMARFKMVKWWAQCYLIGIPRVICGYRTDDGIVEQVKSYRLSELHDEGREFWSPLRMFHFLDKFLDFIKTNVTVDDPKEVVIFEFVPEQQIINCMTLPKDHADYNRYVILPEWYLVKLGEHLD